MTKAIELVIYAFLHTIFFFIAIKSCFVHMMMMMLMYIGRHILVFDVYEYFQ